MVESVQFQDDLELAGPDYLGLKEKDPLLITSSCHLGDETCYKFFFLDFVSGGVVRQATNDMCLGGVEQPDGLQVLGFRIR